MEQRKLLLPPFKGARMKAYEPLIEEIAIAEVDTWPVGVEFPTAKSMQRITLRAILRAVFGAEGARAAPSWRRCSRRGPSMGQHLSRFPQIQKDCGRFSPWGRFLRLRARVDAILDTLIEDAKRDPDLDERPDVLALMVQARRDDGSRADQRRDPRPARHDARRRPRDDRAHAVAGRSSACAATRTSWRGWSRRSTRRRQGASATRRSCEVQRMRPVISFAGRHTIQPFEVGGYRIPKGRADRPQRRAHALRPQPVRAPRPASTPIASSACSPGHLRVDPVRRRAAALHRRDVRAHGARRRPARDPGARALRADRRARRARGSSRASRGRPAGGGMARIETRGRRRPARGAGGREAAA